MSAEHKTQKVQCVIYHFCPWVFTQSLKAKGTEKILKVLKVDYAVWVGTLVRVLVCLTHLQNIDYRYLPYRYRMEIAIRISSHQLITSPLFSWIFMYMGVGGKMRLRTNWEMDYGWSTDSSCFSWWKYNWKLLSIGVLSHILLPVSYCWFCLWSICVV